MTAPDRRQNPEPSDSMRARLPGAVRAVLASSDRPEGLTSLEVWCKVAIPLVHSSWIEPVLAQLAADGEATSAPGPHGDQWTLKQPNRYGDVRCPNDGEWTNVRCWKCGWLR